MLFWFQSVWSGALFALLAVAAWWTCFHAPLGARTIRAGTVIPAAAEAVWRLVDPRAKRVDWNPNLELRDVRIVGEDPLVVESFARQRGSDGDLQRVVTTYLVVEPARRFTRRVDWSSESARGEPTERIETLALTPARGGVRVSMSVQGPIRGLIPYEMTKASLRSYLKALKSEALGRTVKQPPSIEFAGGRVAAVAFGAAALTFGMPFAISGGWIAAYVALSMPATVMAVILVHELGHALAFLAFGHRRVTISLIPFAGGAAWSRRSYSSAFEQGIVALGGAALSAALCLPLLPALGYVEDVIAAGLGVNGPPQPLTGAGGGLLMPLLALLAFPLVAWQALLSAVNLLPLPGLDGDAALAAIATDRRVRLAAGVVCLILFGAAAGWTAAPWLTAIVVGTFLVMNHRTVSTPPPAAPTAAQRATVAAMFAATCACVGYEGSRVVAFVANLSALVARHAA